MNSNIYRGKKDDFLYSFIEIPFFSKAKNQDLNCITQVSLSAKFISCQYQEPDDDIYGDNQW